MAGIWKGPERDDACATIVERPLAPHFNASLSTDLALQPKIQTDSGGPETHGRDGDAEVAKTKRKNLVTYLRFTVS